jgi:hypothetical protein
MLMLTILGRIAGSGGIFLSHSTPLAKISGSITP